MRTSTAYFAGAGTVIAAIVGGVGGGLLIADMIHPNPPKQGTETSRLERRMSPEPIQTASAPSEPVQYLGASQLPGSANVASAAVPVQPQTENANAAPAQPAGTPAVAPPAVSDARPAAPATQPVASDGPPTAVAAAQPVTREQPAEQAVQRERTAGSDEALARARDADAKRAAEKRKAERRQQWAERRRQRQQEFRPVEVRVREDTDPRQEFAAEPVRMGMPQIRLFGSNEDRD